MDRAGLSANDGPTHHGLFDISYLRCVPHAVVMQPRTRMNWSTCCTPRSRTKAGFHPLSRGAGTGVKIKAQPGRLPIGQAEVLREGSNIMIWALGPMITDALALAIAWKRRGLSVGVVNARFAKPLDRTLLLSQAACMPLIVTMEDHVVTGGFGSAVLETLQEADCHTAVERIGWPDHFIEHGSSVASCAPPTVFHRTRCISAFSPAGGIIATRT